MKSPYCLLFFDQKLMIKVLDIPNSKLACPYVRVINARYKTKKPLSARLIAV